jgi:cold shock protein
MRLSVLFPGSLGNSEEKYYGTARCGPPKNGGYVMSSGTVKWFNGQKGYGFIQPDDGSKDVFVHITALERAGLRGLNEGQRVTYDLERGQQGKTSAVNLRAE